MLGTERILNQIVRVCLYLRSQRLAYQNCCVLPVGSLAGSDRPRHHCFSCPHWLAYIQALAGYGTMVVTERSGL